MKLKNLFTLILSTVFVFSLGAQIECDCPESDWGSEGICVEVGVDSLVVIGWAPDDCLAACWYGDEYTVIPCEDWEWEDECDCPEEDWEGEGFCIEVTEDGQTWTDWTPSECYAACWYGEYTIVECEDWGWEDDCDCPEEDWEGEGLCVEIIDIEYDSIGYTTWVPSECYAACWFDAYTVTECEDWGWEDDCDCPEEDWEGEGFCIEVTEMENDSTGYVTWVPSECYASCWYDGYIIAECEDWGWVDDCDCPEEDWNGEGFCIEVMESEVDTFLFDIWVPSDCYAACWYGEYTIVECNDWGWEDDCDCPEEDWNNEGICVEIIYDNETYTEWAPSECYAACWYEEYTVSDCGEDGWPGGNGGFCDWELDCECELDTEEGICILFVLEQDTLIEWVPNECFADCWGFENYGVVDCENYWDWEDEEEGDFETEYDGDIECLTALFESEIVTFQGFLIGLHDCGAIALDDCVLTAPSFDSDEEFINYLVENCPDWFGFIMDESEGPSLFKQFGEVQANGATTAIKDLSDGLDVILLGNPVVDQLDVQINTTELLNLQVTLRTISGSTLNSEKITLNKGTQVYSLDIAGFTSGTYLLTMASEKGIQTIKFVVAR